jgi:hypothetical protein
MKESAEFLGDGLFVEFDGWEFRLFTEREIGVHEVYLEPGVLQNFLDFIKRVQQEQKRNG